MLYLLDANVFIDANRDYYPLSRIPEFWDWLLHHGELGEIKVPLECYEEFKDGKDELGLWAKEEEVKAAILLSEEADVAHVSRVVDVGYAPDLTDDEIEKLGRDPFLVAYALADPDHRCVVTTEHSKPRRQRANRHLPDVCSTMGIQSCDTFEFLRRMNFRTDWRTT